MIACYSTCLTVMFEFPVGFQDSSTNGLVFIISHYITSQWLHVILHFQLLCLSLYNTVITNTTNGSCVVQMHSVCVPACNVGVSLNFEL